MENRLQLLKDKVVEYINFNIEDVGVESLTDFYQTFMSRDDFVDVIISLADEIDLTLNDNKFFNIYDNEIMIEDPSYIYMSISISSFMRDVSKLVKWCE